MHYLTVIFFAFIIRLNSKGEYIMNFGQSVNLTKDIVTYSNFKNNIISNNLSNISNPQYKRKYLNIILHCIHYVSFTIAIRFIY